MSFVFQPLKVALGTGFDWTTADVRLLLIYAAGGYDPDPTVDFLSAIDGELPAVDVANYERKPVTGRTIIRDDSEAVVRWLADSVLFEDLGQLSPSLGVGGAILYVHETDDSDSWPAIYLSDVGGSPNGTDFTVAFDPLGVLRLRAPE